MTLAASPFEYVPGDSPLHRLSAVPKVLWLAAGLAFPLVALHPLPLLLVAGGAGALAVWAGIGAELWRAMRVLAPLAASIVVLQVAAPGACPAGCTPVAAIGPVAIGAEALGRGVAFVSRLLAMEAVAVVVLVSTRPADLLGALVRLRVPRAVALMIATTVQLVPLLGRELGIVLDAQRARGLRASGLRALVPALLPVFVSGFERVSRLAIAMEARGYGAPIARTSYRTAALGPGERLLALAGAAAGVAGVAAGLSVWGAASVPPLVLPSPVAVALVALAALSFAGVVVRALVSLARL